MTKKRLGDFGGQLPPEGHWDREKHQPSEGTPQTPIPPELAATAQIANNALDKLINWMRSNNLNVRLPVEQEPSCQDTPQLFSGSVVLGPASGWRPIATFTAAAGCYGVVHSVGVDLSIPGLFGTFLWRFLKNNTSMGTFENFTLQFGSLLIPQRIKVVLAEGTTFVVQGNNSDPLAPNVTATARIDGWQASNAGQPNSPLSRFKDVCAS